MAASRHPGPIGREPEHSDIQDGTLVLAKSPAPGVAQNLPPHTVRKQIRYHRSPTFRGALPTLRPGVRCEPARWAQVLLNLHHASKEALKADGLYGPRTQSAVREFQRRKSLTVDGVIGKETWEALQFLESELPYNPNDPLAPKAFGPVVPAVQPQYTNDTSVRDWSLTRRFREVVMGRAPRHMLPALAMQFKALLTPVNAGIMIGSLVALAVAQAFGVGEAVDAILAVVAWVFVGWGAFQAGKDLGKCMGITVTAETYADLDTAGGYLADAVAILGVTTFLVVLTGALRRLRAGGDSTGGEPGEKPPGPNPGGNDMPPKDSPPPEKEPAQNEADPAAERAARLEELAKDPAQGGKATVKTRREAEVALSLEERGGPKGLDGPVERSVDPKADFVDANGQKWDVKTYNSNYRNGFELETAMKTLRSELGKGENVIYDTKDMSAADIESLRNAVDDAGLSQNVRWFP